MVVGLMGVKNSVSSHWAGPSTDEEVGSGKFSSCGMYGDWKFDSGRWWL